MTSVTEEKLVEVFMRYAVSEGYDFEQCMCPTPKKNSPQLYHMLFSKKVFVCMCVCVCAFFFFFRLFVDQRDQKEREHRIFFFGDRCRTLA